jgi:hypothetical protein
LKRHPELWVSAILFLFSYLFVSSFARIAHWTLHVENSRMGQFCKWDCGWYSMLVTDGYDPYPRHHARGDAANWAFFPLFPLTGAFLARTFGAHPATAVVLAGRIELYFAILSFLVFVRSELETISDYFFAGSLIALNPYLIYGQSGYSEPLYFTLVCLSFIFLQRYRWVASGVAGALLSATRLVGLVFAASYMIVALREAGWRKILRDHSLAIPIGALLCPLGLVLYSLYLYHLTGDALAFSHIQTAWGRSAQNPFMVIDFFYLQREWFRVWSVTAIFALLVSVWLMKVRLEYGIFLAATVLMGAASGSLYGMPRYTWWQPTFLYALLVLLKRVRPAWPVYFVFAGGMSATMIVAWFMDQNFVT